MFNEEELTDQLHKYVINEEDKDLIYGTSGFRTSAVRLFGIAYRIGIMAVLKSMKEGGAVIGIMVTASHNEASDNGLKVIDRGGEMLEDSWEEVALELVRQPIDNVAYCIRSVCAKRNIDLSVKGSVFLGEDNRVTSSAISQAISCGINTLSGKCTYFDKITTPQLHFLVYKQNCLETNYQINNLNCYFQQLCNSFKCLMSLGMRSGNSPLYVDCANGVGAKHLFSVRKFLEPYLDYIHLCNVDDSGNIVNLLCGADYVKAKLKFPKIHNGEKMNIRENERWAAIDGDADRLIYFFERNKKLCILDGDKQSVLISKYLKEQLEKIPAWKDGNIKLGVVQTAYANYNCTKMLKENIGIPIACVPTGVKYLHHFGKEFDIRIYFETNGHGSILLSQNAQMFLEKNLEIDHPLRFIILNGIINEAVGDSFSILLLIEYILIHTNTSLDLWFDMYDDFPSCLLTVKIRDRRILTTENCERSISKPTHLQAAIDETMGKTAQGYISRVFIRPSGTEDVVRVYAESEKIETAVKIAIEISRLVYDHVGGVGERL